MINRCFEPWQTGHTDIAQMQKIYPEGPRKTQKGKADLSSREKQYKRSPPSIQMFEHFYKLTWKKSRVDKLDNLNVYYSLLCELRAKRILLISDVLIKGISSSNVNNRPFISVTLIIMLNIFFYLFLVVVLLFLMRLFYLRYHLRRIQTRIQQQ